MSDDRRHSVAETATLISDPIERAKKEAENGLRQFDLAAEMILSFTEQKDRPFKLRPSIIQRLHRAALEGLSSYAGNWRPASVAIGGSAHKPVEAFLVAEKIEELCDYVNENWENSSAIHLCAYCMWRLNWIHPFDDGNGRTSRMLSYLVLCIKLGYLLPGSLTIPEQIAENKDPYYRSLEAADKAYINGSLDVNELEKVLKSLLAKQLASIWTAATHENLGDE